MYKIIDAGLVFSDTTHSARIRVKMHFLDRLKSKTTDIFPYFSYTLKLLMVYGTKCEIFLKKSFVWETELLF